MATLGKQLMKFIADKRLIRPHVDFLTDTGKPVTRYDWPEDGEAVLNEWLQGIHRCNECGRMCKYEDDHPCEDTHDW